MLLGVEHFMLDAPLAQQAGCLLSPSDAADERSSVDHGGRRILQKKKKKKLNTNIEATNEQNKIDKAEEIHRKQKTKKTERI